MGFGRARAPVVRRERRGMVKCMAGRFSSEFWNVFCQKDSLLVDLDSKLTGHETEGRLASK